MDSHSFVGTKGGLDNKIERDKLDYRALSKAGYCTITDKKSGIINLQQVIDYMINHIQENDLQVEGIFYDPYNICYTDHRKYLLLVNHFPEYD